jgi:hypothetical protein
MLWTNVILFAGCHPVFGCQLESVSSVALLQESGVTFTTLSSGKEKKIQSLRE